MAKTYTGPVLSHWATLIDNFNTSALDFYSAVTEALDRRQIPDVKSRRTTWSEGGVGSAKREYLRIQRGRFRYEICAAPFGTGFFFSSWLTEKRPDLSATALFLIAYFALLGFGWWLIGESVRANGFYGSSATVITFGGLILFAILFFLVLAGLVGEDTMAAMPLIGPFYVWVFRPLTFYRYDTALMFQKSVHNAVLEVIDSLTTTKGLRALAPDERKPVLAGFLNRAA